MRAPDPELQQHAERLARLLAVGGAAYHAEDLHVIVGDLRCEELADNAVDDEDAPQCRDALIRHRSIGQQDVGQREAILNQSRDAVMPSYVTALLVTRTLDSECQY